MARSRGPKTLHLIRDVLHDPVARSVLGKLSETDLDALEQHHRKGALRPDLDAILGHNDPAAQAKVTGGPVGDALSKLEPHQVQALSAAWAAPGGQPACS
jgi:hypothetical protein